MLTIWRSLTCYIFTLVMLFATGFASISAQTREPSGVISGRVTIAGKGVGGVMVAFVLMNPNGTTTSRAATSRTTTDEDGRFRITSLSTGRWRIVPIAPTLSGPPAAGPYGQTVILSEAETVDGINLEMVRGAVITGRITDAAGQPLIAERITLTLIDAQGRKRPYFQTNTNSLVYETDDRGIYRIYGLPSGRYLVSVGDSPNSGTLRMGTGRGYYLRTYHAGVTDESRATIVELAEGSEASGVDISAGTPLKTFSAAGRVVDTETGKAVPSVGLGYGTSKKDEKGRGVSSSFTSGANRTNASGEFRLEGLLPGQYTAEAVSQEGTDWYSDPAQFEVIDSDVDEVVIRVTRAGSITGVATIEGSPDPAAVTRLSEIQLMVSSILSARDSIPPPMPPGARGSPKIASDGTFRISGLRPGRFMIVMNPIPLEKDFALVRVERGGVAQPEGVEVGPGEQVTGVRLVFAQGMGTIKGTVRVEGGTLPPEALMILNVRPLSPDSAASVGATVDVRGRFVANSVPPGDYELTLSVFMRVPGYQPVKPVKQNVTVTNGVETDVTFTVQAPVKKEGNQ